MGIRRREFLKRSALAGTALWLGARAQAAPTPEIEFQAPLSPPALDISGLARYVDALPVPPIAVSNGYRTTDSDPSRRLPYYRIEMRQFSAKVHRDLPPTVMWGYQSSSPGPTFETRSGQGLLVEWVNLLPDRHLFAIDHSLHGAEEDKPAVRTVVHVHGARVTPENDGYPEDWYTTGKSAIYHYPNDQAGAALWYHDHALGITRLNIFAGLFGAYLIRDDAEEHLDLPRGRYEIPLMIYDRSFSRGGRLNYPVGPIFGHPWVPEFFGNSILINGKLFPYLDVEPRCYRFRVFNVSNGRTFQFSLAPSRSFFQIGTDQGLLDSPVEQELLRLAPAERADLLLDFSGLEGKQLTLRSDDREIMQFRVARAATSRAGAMPVHLGKVARIPSSPASKVRMLTLDEYMGPGGRIERSLLNGTRWSAPVSETPTQGTTEVWELINLTKDAHPIHLHAVRFQILDRRPFDAAVYSNDRKLRFTGPAVRCDAGEAGWKDVVRADPGAITRIIVRFDGFAGRYSWHCHILEHEDNEMMRPLVIVPRGSSAQAQKRSLIRK